MRLAPPRALLLCAFASLGAACGRIERTSDCRELALTVNPRVAELEALAKAKTEASYGKLAAGYEALASAVAGLDIARTEVAPDVKMYVESLRSAAKSCREYQAALRAGGVTSNLDRDLERTTRRERVAAAKLTAYCSP